jgi:hypothetical protein
MAIALIVLAIGSVVAGYVGLGARFEHFLEPSFAPQAAPSRRGRRARVTLMVVSSSSRSSASGSRVLLPARTASAPTRWPTFAVSDRCC